MMTRDECAALDAADPLGSCRDAFQLPDVVVYLDGNSLGPLTHAAARRMETVVREEWGDGLIRSWNAADWINAGTRIGDRIANLVGAGPGEIVVGDSTSVNVFKQVAAAVKMRPGRKVIVSEAGNFPTDLYMVQGLIKFLDDGHELRLVEDGGDVLAAVDDNTAVVMLTQVDYRTGRMLDMAAVTAAVQAQGALMLWDLCHSAGAVPVDLNGANADLAIGCTYKYLNGGPGAPAFLYVPKRLQDNVEQPLSGWMGHAAPFDFSNQYQPASGIERNLCGSHTILALSALDSALDVWDGLEMAELRTKSLRQTDLFIELVEGRCAEFGFELDTPREHGLRGSQVSFRHEHAFPIMQALIAAGVIGDYREPNVLRFGFTPLYLRYTDVWDAVDTLFGIMDAEVWRAPEYSVRGAVT